MKRYTMYIEDKELYWSGEINVCEVTASDVEKAKKEWDKYRQGKGEAYKHEPKKEGTFSRFCAIFFGTLNEDAWEWTDFPYSIPDRIICTNKNVAQRAYEFLKPLDYHNTFHQTYRTVNLEKNIIDIVSGDY